MARLLEARKELDAKNAALAEIFKSAKTESGEYDLSSDQVEEIRTKNAEISDLGKAYDSLREAEDIAGKVAAAQKAANQPQRNVPHGDGSAPPGWPEGMIPFDPRMFGLQAPRKSLGQSFVGNDIYVKATKKGKPEFAFDIDDVDFKTTLTETGYVPANPRTGIVIPSAQRRLVVADLIPQTTTTLQIINYMRETTFTNNAAFTSENAAKPESALDYTQIASPVQKVATFLPVTEEVLDDVPSMESMIDDRLTLMVLLAEEVGLLSGNGTPPQLTGFYNTSGINTQAKSTDPTPDACYKAMTLVRETVGFADPSGWIFHPTDWQAVKLLKTTTGEYIWGNPAETGPDRLWGLPVVQTIAATLGTALTGDFRMYSHISRRMGLRIDVSNSHASFFINNLLAIRAEERLSLEIYRPSAFATVTGL